MILAAGLLPLVLPTVDAPHSLAHEVSAVNTLRIIITLQNQYAAAQADRGFACELPTLTCRAARSSLLLGVPDHRGAVRVQVFTGELSLRGEPSQNPLRSHSRSRPKAASQAFGLSALTKPEWFWYDENGSVTNCLAQRHALSVNGRWS